MILQVDESRTGGLMCFLLASVLRAARPTCLEGRRVAGLSSDFSVLHGGGISSFLPRPRPAMPTGHHQVRICSVVPITGCTGYQVIRPGGGCLRLLLASSSRPEPAGYTYASGIARRYDSDNEDAKVLV